MDGEKIFFIFTGIFVIITTGVAVGIPMMYGENLFSSITDIFAIIGLIAIGIVFILAGIFEKY